MVIAKFRGCTSLGLTVSMHEELARSVPTSLHGAARAHGLGARNLVYAHGCCKAFPELPCRLVCEGDCEDAAGRRLARGNE